MRLGDTQRGGSANSGAFYELKDKFYELKDEFDKLVAKKEALDKQLSSATTENEELKKQNAELNQKIDKIGDYFSKQFKDFESNYLSERQSYEDKIEKLQTALAESASNNNASEIASLQQEIQNAKNDLDKKTVEVYGLSQTIRSLKKTKQNAINEMFEAIELYEDLCQEVALQKEVIEEIQTSVNNKDAKYAELLKKFRASNLNASTYRRSWEAQKRNTEKAQAQVKQVNKELNATKKSLKEEVAKVQDLNNANKQLTDENKKISRKARQENLNARITAMEQKQSARKASEAGHTIAQQSREIGRLNEKLENAQNARIEAESRRISANIEAYNQKQRAESAEESLSATQEQLGKAERKVVETEYTVNNATNKWKKAEKQVVEQKRRANQAKQEKQNAIEQRDYAVREMNSALQERDSAIEEKKATAVERDTAQKGWIKTKKGLRLAVMGVIVAVLVGGSVAGILGGNLRVSNDTIGNLNNEITDKDNTIKDQNSALTDKDNTIKDQNSALTDKDNQIEDISDKLTVAEQDKLIKEMNNTITEAKGNAEKVNSNYENATTLNELGFGNSTIIESSSTTLSHYEIVKLAQDTVDDIVTFEGEKISEDCALSQAFKNYQSAVRNSDNDSREEYKSEIEGYISIVNDAHKTSEASFSTMLHEAGISSVEEIAKLKAEKEAAEKENEELKNENENLKQENEELKKTSGTFTVTEEEEINKLKSNKTFYNILAGNEGAISSAVCEYKDGIANFYVNAIDDEGTLYTRFVSFNVNKKVYNSIAEVLANKIGNQLTTWNFYDETLESFDGKQVSMDVNGEIKTGTAEVMYTQKGSNKGASALVILRDALGNIVERQLIADTDYYSSNSDNLKKHIESLVDIFVDIVEFENEQD